MRVGVVDIGTNSTRLLVADVEPGSPPRELERRSVVTRLGDGVDATGRLGEAPRQRVLDTLAQYGEVMEALGAERRAAVLTSAVRDAANGPEFAERVRSEHALEGRVLSGDEEARLTFLGATAARDRSDPTELLVIDIGGGSTELVVGARGEVDFHVSTQNGVVRHTERHLHGDPPRPEELAAIAAAVRGSVATGVPEAIRRRPAAAVAVAGTATSLGAIDVGLEPVDPARVEGHVLTAARIAELRDELAALPVGRRREVPGLHPDRAPTIVAGAVILAEVLAAFGLDRVEISDRDILWGVALEA